MADRIVSHAVQLPKVTYTEHFDLVTIRAVVNPNNPYEYWETELTPREARRLALELLQDAERAEYAIERGMAI